MHRCSYEPTFNLERPSCCSETWIDGHVGVSEKGSPQSSFAIAFNQLRAPHFQSPMLVTRLYHGDCPQWICGHVDANYGTRPRSRVPANLVYVYNICVCIYILHMYTYIPTYLQTYRHTDIQTYRHTDIQAYRHTDIQTYRHTDIQTYRHTYIQTYRHTDIQTYRHTDIQTYRHTDIQTYRHTDIQTYRHTYMHACMHTYIHTYI